MRRFGIWAGGLIAGVAVLAALATRCDGAAAPARPAPASAPVAAETPVLVPQQGHVGEVTAMAASADGRLLATGGSDGTIRVWDPERGRVLAVLAVAPGRTIKGVALLPRDRIAFADTGDWGAEMGVHLWDLATGRVTRSFHDHPFSLNLRLAASPDGELLAAVSGGRLTVWEIETGDLYVQLAAAGIGLSFLDERRVAFQSGEGAMVLDLRSGPPALRVVPTGVGEDLAVSPDGKTLAHILGSRVTLWDLSASAAEKITAVDLLSDPWLLTFSRDGRSLFAGDRQGYVYRLRGERWEDLVGFVHLREPLTAMTAAGGATLATGMYRDGTAVLWSTADARPVRRLGLLLPEITTLDLAADASYLVAGDEAGAVRVWDLAAGSTWIAEDPPPPPANVPATPSQPGAAWVTETFHAGSWPAPKRDPILAARLSADGHLALVRTGGRVEVWNLSFRRRLLRLEVPDAADALVRGDECLVVAKRPEVQAWRLKDGVSLEGYAAPAGASSLALSSDGRRLAVSGTTEVVVYEGREVVGRFSSLHAGEDIRSPGGGLRFFGSGDTLLRLAEGMSDRLVEHLDLATRRVDRWPGPAATIAGGRRIAVAGGSSGVVQVWEAGATAPLAQAAAHDAAVSAVALSSDGETLVTAGADAAIKVWQTRSLRPLATLQLLPGRDWLVSSPAGFFDGSPVGWTQVPFRFPSEPLRVYEPEQFFHLFFQPGLLHDVLARGRPIEQILEEADDPRAARRLASFRGSRIPEARIVAPQNTIEIETGRGGQGEWSIGSRKIPALFPSELGSVRVRNPELSERRITLEAEVRDTGSGIQDCRVFQNGVLVHEHAGALPVEPATRTGRLRAELEILAGVNELSVYCFNADNVRSEIQRVRVEGAKTLERPRRAYIIAAGVDDYHGALSPLKYAQADAAAALEVLGQSLKKTGNYEKVVTVPLLGDQGSKRNLLAALERLAGDASPRLDGVPPELEKLAGAHLEDTVVIFFAGHGTARGERYFLLPSGATAGAEVNGGLSDRELEAALREIDASHMLLILDTCRSGQVLMTAEEARRGPLNVRGFAQLAYEKRLRVLAASQSYQAAYETSLYGHGLLTYALIRQGLESFLADTSPNDGSLLAEEWLAFASSRVPELQAQMAGERGAEVFADSGEDPFRAVRYQQPQIYVPADEPVPLVVGVRAPPQPQ